MKFSLSGLAIFFVSNFCFANGACTITNPCLAPAPAKCPAQKSKTGCSLSDVTMLFDRVVSVVNLKGQIEIFGVVDASNSLPNKPAEARISLANSPVAQTCFLLAQTAERSGQKLSIQGIAGIAVKQGLSFNSVSSCSLQ